MNVNAKPGMIRSCFALVEAVERSKITARRIPQYLFTYPFFSVGSTPGLRSHPRCLHSDMEFWKPMERDIRTGIVFLVVWHVPGYLGIHPLGRGITGFSLTLLALTIFGTTKLPGYIANCIWFRNIAADRSSGETRFQGLL